MQKYNIKARGISVDSVETGEDIKLQIHVCSALHNREWFQWLQMDGITKKIWKLAHDLIYMKFNRWSKNGTIAKAIAFFL